MEKKVCGKCRLPKFTTDFGKSSKAKDGLQGYCKECMTEYKRQPGQRTKAAEVKRRQRERDPEGQKRLRNESHARTRLSDRARSKAWRKANPEKFKAAVKAWYDAHPEAKARNRNRRRVRQAQAEGNHSRVEWQEKKAEYDNRCAYCSRATKLTRHHVVPLSKGGTDWISNIVPACGSCNSKIGTRTVPPPSRKTSCTEAVV